MNNAPLPLTRTEQFIQNKLLLAPTGGSKITLIGAGVLGTSVLLGCVGGFAYAKEHTELLRYTFLSGVAAAFGTYVAISNTVWREEEKLRHNTGDESFATAPRKQVISLLLGGTYILAGFTSFSDAFHIAYEKTCGKELQPIANQIDK